MSPRNESGAVAIVVAFLALLLLSIAALGVDIGHAYVERQDVQKLTDFASLAGAEGDNLPGSTPGVCAYGKRAAASDQAVLDVAGYLGSEVWAGGPTPAQLVDCSIANGEVFYGTVTRTPANPSGVLLSYDPQKVSVISPPRHVDFGMAQVIGFSGTDVTGSATASAGTPGSTKVIPSYAVSGCDWGQQTITDPANGHVVDFVPVLKYPTDTNVATLSAASSPNPSPSSVDVNPASPVTLTISGTHLDDVTKVGFFQESDGVGPAPEPVVIPNSALTHTGGGNITLTLPDAANAPNLTDHDGLWWVRVWAPIANHSTTYQWSAVALNNGNAATVPFKVGAAYLRCVGASNAGNYGTLKLPRTDTTPSSWISVNIAKNLQSPLTLHTYPGAPTTVGGTSAAPDLCDPNDTTRTIYSTTTGTPVLRTNTNCVDTDTGLPANAVSAGLVEGVGSDPGRLAASTGTACAPLRTVELNGNHTMTINNDVLTCFLQDGVTLSTIENPGYTGPAVLSCDVFDSPRFFYQPVLQVRPSGGGSNHYSIIDFRPAFITDQAPGAIKGTGPATTDNGVVISNGAVTQVNVVFFNNNALSSECENAVGPALGGTTKRTVALTN